MSRISVFVALVVAVVVVAAAPASADPAGPTDYRSEIVAIDPAVDSLEVRIVGGDSFLELEVVDTVEVLVPGYRAEPYLWFAADGTVRENQRSPSKWQNDDRYGDTEAPPEADADADPDWKIVATDGRYAWHDHRIHWMQPGKPPGAEPGEVVAGSEVPLTVDGVAVALTVESVLLEPAPWWPALLGGIAAAAACAAAVRFVGLGRGMALVVAGTSGLALGMGVAATVAVPAVAAPGFAVWLLPAVALAAAAGALAMGGRRPPTAELLVALGGVQLGLWGWNRLDALQRAYIPTDAPQQLDRAVIAAALVVGAAAIGTAVWAIVRPPPVEAAAGS